MPGLAGVPGFGGGTAAIVPLPQPVAPPIRVTTNSRPRYVLGLRNPNISRDAMAIREPPIATTPGGVCLPATGPPFTTLDAGVVLTVSVVVTAVAPVIAGGDAVEHVGGSASPVGPPATEQLRATLPVNPPLGVIVIVDVADAPADAMVTAAPVIVKP